MLSDCAVRGRHNEAKGMNWDAVDTLGKGIAHKVLLRWKRLSLVVADTCCYEVL